MLFTAQIMEEKRLKLARANPIAADAEILAARMLNPWQARQPVDYFGRSGASRNNNSPVTFGSCYRVLLS